ncbi:Receptor-type tyrosine-protein phosphatase S [Takifugu flavidus]|uniref:Receptor-type tyrosine-protein phosphatase S n=1 Tax=Takifugu flavidus TaxID=433684 RepID=A0A5C6P188_9TELE|nr:Receptor-type tyrosine-protein phosphatase S [Takifugu flavidus]
MHRFLAQLISIQAEPPSKQGLPAALLGPGPCAEQRRRCAHASLPRQTLPRPEPRCHWITLIPAVSEDASSCKSTHMNLPDGKEDGALPAKSFASLFITAATSEDIFTLLLLLLLTTPPSPPLASPCEGRHHSVAASPSSADPLLPNSRALMSSRRTAYHVTNPESDSSGAMSLLGAAGTPIQPGRPVLRPCLSPSPLWMLLSFIFFITSHFSCICGAPAPPKFTKIPTDQIGVSGGVASFVCQASGSPKPVVYWNKKGKKVNSQRIETIEFDEGAGAVLRIQPLRAPRDENTYECVARNSEGEVSVTAKLAIIRDPGPGRDSRARLCQPVPARWRTLSKSRKEKREERLNKCDGGRGGEENGVAAGGVRAVGSWQGWMQREQTPVHLVAPP